MFCLNCGSENESFLCEKCLQTADIEKLCKEISSYVPDKNPLWDSIARKLSNPWNFRKTAFALATYLPSPKKEYMQILSLAGWNRECVIQEATDWFFETYFELISNPELTSEQVYRLKGMALCSCCYTYCFDEAEKIAEDIVDGENMPYQCYLWYCKVKMKE